MEYVVESLVIIGIIALIATAIKYPKDVGKVILGFLFLPFTRMWDMIRFILIPFELLIVYIEQKLKVNYLTKFITRESKTTKKKTKECKQINFTKFKKYIIVNTISEQIEDELLEANDCFLELNIDDYSVTRSNSYAVIEVPRAGFYGYNFLIQWFTEKLNENEIVGFASNGRTRFLTMTNPETENDMIGRTNTGKKFWVSLYDNLDEKQFLRVNNELELKSDLNTESLEKMVKNAM